LQLFSTPYRTFLRLGLLGSLLLLLSFDNKLNAQSFNPKSSELVEDIAYISSVEKFEEHQQWNSLVRKLERRADADESYFLEYLFYKTHQMLLKNYSKGTAFDDLMETGNYDCVSASISYSVLLNYFDIEHSIIETDYHVFITARANNREFILETTDPRNGWISDEDEIKAFKNDFLPSITSELLDQNKAIGALVYGQPNSKTIYKEISLRQLSALQYFNQGLIAVNKQDFQLATVRLQQALNLYKSDRINAVFEIIAQ
jgi:hypothetical protein